MNHVSRNANRNFRNKVLAGAIVAALALGTAGTAAADSVYTFNGAQTLTLQNYLQMIGNQQEQTAPVSASVANGETGYRGPASGGSLTVTGNTFQALTLDATTNLLGANGADNSVDLGLLGIQSDSLPPGDANQGIGIFSGQLNMGAVRTLLDHDNIGLDLTDYTTGDATVTGNTLNSTILVNGASNRAAGTLNTTPFSSTTAGQVSVDYAPAGAGVAAIGGVTIGNAQIAAGVDSSAQVTDSNIALVNTMTVPGSSGAPVTVTGNTANADDTVNRGDNRFVAAEGGAVSYTGSVGVVNGQANLGGSTTATASDTAIGAELDGTVKAVNAQSGDSVAADEVLVEFV